MYYVKTVELPDEFDIMGNGIHIQMQKNCMERLLIFMLETFHKGNTHRYSTQWIAIDIRG